MLVCHCRGLCDRTIRACANRGALSVEAVGQLCGAGTGCGGCQPVIEDLIEEELGRRLPVIDAGDAPESVRRAVGSPLDGPVPTGS